MFNNTNQWRRRQPRRRHRATNSSGSPFFEWVGPIFPPPNNNYIWNGKKGAGLRMRRRRSGTRERNFQGKRRDRSSLCEKVHTVAELFLSKREKKRIGRAWDVLLLTSNTHMAVFFSLITKILVKWLTERFYDQSDKKPEWLTFFEIFFSLNFKNSIVVRALKSRLSDDLWKE